MGKLIKMTKQIFTIKEFKDGHWWKFEPIPDYQIKHGWVKKGHTHRWAHDNEKCGNCVLNRVNARLKRNVSK